MGEGSQLPRKFMRSLKNIERKMDILIALQKRIAPVPNIGEEENKTLQLCNKKNTIDDMMEKTGKKRGNVKTVLYNLRNKGLIISVKTKDKKTVYERI